MNKVDENQSFFKGFLGFLSLELAPNKKRVRNFLHQIICCSLIIIISMALDIKFLTLSLLIVFVATLDNARQTQKTIISLFFATFFIYGLAFSLLSYTFDYPLLRILLAFFIVFIGMFLFRISPIGQIGYMMAFFIVYTQSMYDISPDIEGLTRTILWTWIALVYSLVVVLFVNIWIKPIKPQEAIKEAVLKCLDLAIKQMDLKIEQKSFQALSFYDLEYIIKSLNSSIKFIGSENGLDIKMAKLGVAQEILIIINRISQSETSENIENIQELKKIIENLKNALENQIDFVIDREIKFIDSDFQELFEVLNFFAKAKSIEVREKDTLFVFDAFTNPKYSRFAFKTMLATFLCYAFYKATAWEGIYTCMLTCLIVSMPSLGEIKHKSALRLLGCSIGGIFTIFAVVFVLPHCESIVGFLLVSMVIIGLGAWIATGSKRINYAGWQLAFAYILPVCATYDLSTDLVDISNRLVGIFVGVIVTVFIHSHFWPEIKSRDITDDFEDLVKLANEKDSNIFSKIRNFQEIQTELVLNKDWTCETTSNRKVYSINKVYSLIK